MITRRSILAGVATLPLGVKLLSSVSRAQSSTLQFDYYISPTGSDSNAGTEAAPWAITSLVYGTANYASIAGKSVGLLPGTYDISTFSPSAYSAKLTIPSGTAQSPTVIQSTTPLAAVIVSDPGESGYVAGNAIGNGANGTGNTGTPQYITLYGLTIIGGTTPSAVSGVCFAGTTPKSCYGLIIDSCEIYNFVNPSGAVNIGCIGLGPGPMGTTIRNCLLHDCYVSGVSRSTHSNASGVHDYANGTIVENCTIFGCNNGVYQKNSSTVPDGDTIRSCYFYAGAGMNVALCGFNNAMGTTPPYAPLNVYNNVFENVGVYYNSNAGVDGLQANVNFYNNTVYGTGSSCFGIWIPTAAAVAAGVVVSFYNNILVRGAVNGEWGDLTLGPAAGNWAVCNYNCYPTSPQFGLSTDDSTLPTALMSFAVWQAIAGAPDVNSLSGDPGFVGSIVAGAGANQYQLAATSVCKSAGRLGGMSSGTAIDMGAWGGAGTIGCSFAKTPNPPSILSIS